MGANATTFVPSYTSGEVLTAANLSVTNSGIPVFATTVTRDAAFGGTGEKTLAEGQFAYIEATNTTQYYDGANWQSVGVSPGLVRVGGGALTGASTAFTSVFSATYDAYKLTFTNVAMTANALINLQLGATTTGYNYAVFGGLFSSAAYQAVGNGSNTSSFMVSVGQVNAGVTVDLYCPFLTTKTTFAASPVNQTTYFAISGGYLDNSTSYTGFTISAASGNLTGTCNIYGYALS